MLRACVITAGLVALTASCGKSKRDETKLKRSGDGPAVVVLGAEATPAGLAQELEPNDPSPQAVELGAGVQGRLDGAQDVDRYSVVVSERGMLFVLAKGGPDADLIVELFATDGKRLAISDRGPATFSEGIAGMALDPNTYQIVVTEFTKKKLRKSGGRQGISEPYQLRAELRIAPEQGFELEDNGESAGASEILVGEERYGFLGWQGDVDLWRLPITGFDTVDASEGARPALHIVLSAVPGLETKLRLRSSDGALLLERRSATGQEVAIRNFVPEVSAESYLIEVLSSRSNPEDSYVLTVQDAQLARGTEEEPNDTLESATQLQGDAGTLIAASGELCLGDVDVFSVMPAPEERILEVEVVAPGDAKLEIAVIAESGAVLGTLTSTQAGAPLKLSNVPVPANMVPMIRVLPSGLKTPADYRLTLSLVAGHAPKTAPAVAPIAPISE